MRHRTLVPNRAGLALVLLAGVGFLVSPSPSAAQAIVGLEMGAKPGALELEASLERLRDGWRWARLVAGEDAGPDAVADSIARMIKVPVKIGGFESPDDPRDLALEVAIVRTEARVRVAVRAAFRDEAEASAHRAAAQRALDEYLSLLEARRPRDPTRQPGAGGR